MEINNVYINKLRDSLNELGVDIKKITAQLDEKSKEYSKKISEFEFFIEQIFWIEESGCFWLKHKQREGFFTYHHSETGKDIFAIYKQRSQNAYIFAQNPDNPILGERYFLAQCSGESIQEMLPIFEKAKDLFIKSQV